MDDRGEGAAFEGVPELVESDLSACLEGSLDMTAVVVLPVTKVPLQGELDSTTDVTTVDGSCLIDVSDTAIDSDAILDSTLDETVVVVEGALHFISGDTRAFDELDETIVSAPRSEGSTLALSGLVGLVDPVDVVESVKGGLEQFEGEAPAPPPVCTVAGAGVPTAQVQQLAPGMRWAEKSGRAGSSLAKRWFWFLFLLIAAVAVVYALNQYQYDRVDGEETVSLAQEIAPPKGQGLMLTPAQVRYCLAQGVRLDSAAEQSAGLSAAASARLRLVRSDFDQRCTDFQYEPGAILAAKQSVEVDRARLKQQGLSLLASLKLINDPSGVLPESIADSVLPAQAEGQVVAGKIPASVDTGLATTPRELVAPPAPVTSASQEPRRIVKDMQWRLFKLGLFNGSMDGVYGPGTQLAVKEFYRTYSDIAESQVEREIYRDIDGVYVKRQ